MKNLMIILLMCLSLTSFAQDRYETAMLAALKVADTVNSPSGLLAIGNRFERIAAAEKDKWLPYYYSSMMHVRQIFMMQDKSQADPLIDKAEALALMADSLSPLNSEVSCLKSMIASCRLTVDPMSRYMTYGTISSREIDNGISQDPSNPRPHLLRGQGLKYTPEQFGGGCTNALPHLEEAIRKFDSFKPGSDLHPSWGKNLAENLIKECKN